MTTQLIPVFNGSISNETHLLVNARDLHEFLSVGKVFANWIKERIDDYGFVENQDFIIFANSGKNTVGRRRKDYHLTLDTAKELAMVERNDKGRQIRRYFIECEKQLQNQSSKHLILAAPGRYQLLQTIEENQVVESQLIGPNQFCATKDEFTSMLRWCGYVVTRPEDLMKLTAVELTEYIQKCMLRRREWLSTQNA